MQGVLKYDFLAPLTKLYEAGMSLILWMRELRLREVK